MFVFGIKSQRWSFIFIFRKTISIYFFDTLVGGFLLILLLLVNTVLAVADTAVAGIAAIVLDAVADDCCYLSL